MNPSSLSQKETSGVLTCSWTIHFVINEESSWTVGAAAAAAEDTPFTLHWALTASPLRRAMTIQNAMIIRARVLTLYRGGRVAWSADIVE